MAYIESKSEGHGNQGHGGGNDKPKQVTVEVNGNAVVLEEKVMTGPEIKQAAIAQQVQIQPDFVLQLQRPNGEYDPIGDHEEVKVHKGMDFTCIAPDDNS
ncbi:hypothetical protein HK414_26425 [Ramlibacter terrae]|uniref:Multi-ubiquitin domain-containing protein n=1 Tax=Ramlibacter terrae TaxID=2732511 RepID=A0ABX6P5V9_9BURK|nr:hypothetical protein HK414_26425 [Ramlibacter terrae]